MAYPPGVAGYHGPLTSTRRAITPCRLGVMRLAATRLAFCPVDTTNEAGDATEGPLTRTFRSDSEPGVYAPPNPETTFTAVLR